MKKDMSNHYFIGTIACRLAMLLLALVCMNACGASSQPAEPGGERPNIIFILADDLGYGELGAYGQQVIQTPNIDRLAREGKKFTNFYAGGPVCGPSRACLMTGLHQGHGFIKDNPGGKPEKETLRPQDLVFPEKLKEAGYYNACIGKWGLGPKGSTGYPLEKGFDYFVGYDTHVAAHNYYPAKLCSNEGWMELEPGTYSHNVFTQEALDFLKKDHHSPFFLYLAYTIPHSPHNPPSMWPYEQKDWPERAKKYAAMITLMDTDIGKIIAALGEHGHSKNTMVIFTSDNGADVQVGKLTREWHDLFNNNGGLRSGKRSVYDGGIRVPFIAWWPGYIGPGTVDEILAFQDIMPTMMELAGLKDPVKTSGISIAPLLFDTGDKFDGHRMLYWEFIWQGRSGGGQQAALDTRTGYKAVRFGSKGEPKLYNIFEDPAESMRIYGSQEKQRLALQNYLDTVRTSSEFWPMPEYGWFQRTPWEPMD